MDQDYVCIKMSEYPSPPPPPPPLGPTPSRLIDTFIAENIQCGGCGKAVTFSDVRNCFIRISSDKASNLPKRDVRFILLK